MNLYEKLLAIRASVKITKNQKNDSGGYKFSDKENVLSMINEKLVEHKVSVALRNSVIEKETVEVWGTPRNSSQAVLYGKANIQRLEMYVVNAEKPEEAILSIYHTACDNGMIGRQNVGRGVGSGVTYGLRRWYLDFFGVPESDRDDLDNSDDVNDISPDDNQGNKDKQGDERADIGSEIYNKAVAWLKDGNKFSQLTAENLAKFTDEAIEELKKIK